MAKFEDLTGQRFGRWFVLEKTRDKRNRICWICRCDCGTEKVVQGYTLKNGDSTSCGCYRDELESAKKTHGMSHTRLYRVYAHMKDRCYRKGDINYPNYGGRGIRICDEWLGDNGSSNFIKWSLENGYSDELSIDRIDVNGNYEPSNCKWSTRKEQANNKRTNIFYEINGVTKTLQQWCEVYGIERKIFDARLKLNWSVLKALTTPIKKRG